MNMSCAVVNFSIKKLSFFFPVPRAKWVSMTKTRRRPMLPREAQPPRLESLQRPCLVRG